jgi:hypothetical protein
MESRGHSYFRVTRRIRNRGQRASYFCKIHCEHMQPRCYFCKQPVAVTSYKQIIKDCNKIISYLLTWISLHVSPMNRRHQRRVSTKEYVRVTHQFYIRSVKTYNCSCKYFNVGIMGSLMLTCRSQWPRSLRRGSAAVRLLGLRVRLPLRAWMSVSCECCVLSVRGLCVGLITRPEDPYQV